MLLFLLLVVPSSLFAQSWPAYLPDRRASAPCVFMRGDSNWDQYVNPADIQFTLSYLFAGGADFESFDAGDANDDGIVDVADLLCIVDYLYSNGPTPSAPFWKIGIDPTMDSIHPDCIPSPVLDTKTVSVIYDSIASRFHVSGELAPRSFGTEISVRVLGDDRQGITTSINQQSPWSLDIVAKLNDILALKLSGPGGHTTSYIPDFSIIIGDQLGWPRLETPNEGVLAWVKAKPFEIRPSLSQSDFACLGTADRHELGRDWKTVIITDADPVRLLHPVGDFILNGAFVAGIYPQYSAQLHLMSCNIADERSLSVNLLSYYDHDEEPATSIPLGDVIPIGTVCKNGELIFFDIKTHSFYKVVDTDKDLRPDTFVAKAYYSLPVSSVSVNPLLGVCKEVVLMMRAGPSQSAYGGGLQTAIERRW